MNYIVWIVLGAVSGWLASMLTSAKRSIIEDIVLGIVGSIVGGWLLGFVGRSGVTGFDLYSITVSVFGALVVISIGRVLHK